MNRDEIITQAQEELRSANKSLVKDVDKKIAQSLIEFNKALIDLLETLR